MHARRVQAKVISVALKLQEELQSAARCARGFRFIHVPHQLTSHQVTVREGARLRGFLFVCVRVKMCCCAELWPLGFKGLSFRLLKDGSKQEQTDKTPLWYFGGILQCASNYMAALEAELVRPQDNSATLSQVLGSLQTLLMFISLF